MSDCDKARETLEAELALERCARIRAELEVEALRNVLALWAVERMEEERGVTFRVEVPSGG